MNLFASSINTFFTDTFYAGRLEKANSEVTPVNTSNLSVAWYLVSQVTSISRIVSFRDGKRDMRNLAVRSLLVAVMAFGILALFVGSARADSGGPFNPGDGRINPMTGDRVAIYCNADSVDVWGIDSSETGFYMTTFTLNELEAKSAVTHKTSEGNVTLKLDSPAQYHWGFASNVDTVPSWIVDVGAQYEAIWNSPAFGANGSAPFDKFFSCTYLSGITPTATPVGQ